MRSVVLPLCTYSVESLGRGSKEGDRVMGGTRGKDRGFRLREVGFGVKRRTANECDRREVFSVRGILDRARRYRRLRTCKLSMAAAL